MTEDHTVFPLTLDEAHLLYPVLCATPHIYYSEDGGTYTLSASDTETVRALRSLTFVEAAALILTPEQGEALRSAVSRLYLAEDALDEHDRFYREDFAQQQEELKAMLERLDSAGFGKRAIYSLRPHH